MSKIKIYNLKLLFTCLILGFNISYAQDTTFLSVSGIISDLNAGNPVVDHLVLVNFSGGGLEFNYELHTNGDGYYGNDSLVAPSQGEIIVSTFDCDNVLHQQDTIINPASSFFIFNFEICSDTIILECENWFDYTIQNNEYIFLGYSLPEASFYYWDFGDGQTGTGQNIVHEFDPQISNQFLVTLSTIHYDTSGNDSCFSISQQIIQLPGSINCEAGFTFEPIDQDSLTYLFTDTSTDNITEWQWDFGDGFTSTVQNPEHSYLGPGDYTICLTVIVNDSGYFCTDTYCAGLIIMPFLQADFVYSLDTISGLMRNYYFEDSSIGQPTYWLWNFGDGNSSTLQNPEHQFEEEGTYIVSLVTQIEYPNGTVFSDTLFKTINAPNYFDFGGQVFFDGFPLNNHSGDTTIVDTGIAYLYKKYAQTIVPVDTNLFTNYGYYWFTNIQEGDYIIKTGLTENSQHINEAVTTYYKDVLYWQDADVLYLNDTNYYVNINLVELEGTEQGPGSISGFLSLGDYDAINESVLNNTEIYLLNSIGQPLDFTKTDDFGNFNFYNIALSNYKLKAEITGYGSYLVEVNLDENNQSVSGLEIEVFVPSVGIRENIIPKTIIGNVYPNPVTENLNIELEISHFTDLHLQLYSIHGKLLETRYQFYYPGNHTFVYNCSALTGGIYLIKISGSGMEPSETIRFVK